MCAAEIALKGKHQSICAYVAIANKIENSYQKREEKFVAANDYTVLTQKPPDRAVRRVLVAD